MSQFSLNTVLNFLSLFDFILYLYLQNGFFNGVKKMGCSPAGYKTFLICCNVALLFVGLSVLILGMKMKWALAVLLLINIPIVQKAIEAVIATGFFISFSGMSGICGACYESTWLMIVHLVSLGVIVIMEFSLGVTLMVVKKTVENAVEDSNCNNMCAATVDAAILDYALPSAGLMMTIILVEALMIYSSIRLYFYFRDRSKITAPVGPAIVVQNVQMQNVAAPPQSTYAAASHPAYPTLTYVHQPQSGYTVSQYPGQDASQPASIQSDAIETKPPDYNNLPQHPPPYTEPATNLSQPTVEPKGIENNSNPV